MMAPDYTHWHGMYEVAERFYMELIPQAREMADHRGGSAGAAIHKVIDDILARPEHAWFEQGAAEESARIRPGRRAARRRRLLALAAAALTESRRRQGCDRHLAGAE